MKIKNKFLLGASVVLFALACSDDSSSSAKKELSKVSSEKDLPKCEKSTSGDEFCVESLKAGVFCEASSGKWTVDSALACEFENPEDSLDAKDSATSSSAGENSSSSAADSKVSSSSVTVSSSSEEKSSAREESSSSEAPSVEESSSSSDADIQVSSSSEEAPVPGSSAAPSLPESSSSEEAPVPGSSAAPPVPESSSSEEAPVPGSSAAPSLPESSSSEEAPVPGSSAAPAKITSFGNSELEFLLGFGWFVQESTNQWRGYVDSVENLEAALLENGFTKGTYFYGKKSEDVWYQIRLDDFWVSVVKYDTGENPAI